MAQDTASIDDDEDEAPIAQPSGWRAWLARAKSPVSIGAAIVLLAVIGAGGTVALTRAKQMRAFACGKIGLFCPKVVPPSEIAAHPPAVCPQPRLTGSFHQRDSEDEPARIEADVDGRLHWTDGSGAVNGTSSVACFGNQFMATFEVQPNGPVIQCLGMIDGLAYSGSCDRSAAAAGTISGTFND